MDLLNKILLSLFHQYQMQPLATAAMLAVTLVDSSVNTVLYTYCHQFHRIEHTHVLKGIQINSEIGFSMAAVLIKLLTCEVWQAISMDPMD